MIPNKAPVIPLHLHPGIQERHRVKELKTALMTETLAYVQVALDNAAGPGGASPRAMLPRSHRLSDIAIRKLPAAADRLWVRGAEAPTTAAMGDTN
jgi:hypothetical protein